jgi:uncharacterized delta-60 repeat protein
VVSRSLALWLVGRARPRPATASDTAVAADGGDGGGDAGVTHPSGSLDTSFGDGGIVSVSFLGSDILTAVAVQPDGRILVGGGSYVTSGGTLHTPWGIARLKSDGSIDTSFGVNGEVVGTDDGQEIAQILVQPDAKIIAADSTVRVLRFNADGTSDPSWAVNVAGLPLQRDQAGQLLVGKYVGASFQVSRYDGAGVIDPAFGSVGVAPGPTPPPNGRYTPTAFALTASGALVTVGQSYKPAGNGYDAFAYSMLSNGSPDPSFGDGGLVTVVLPPCAPGPTCYSGDFSSIVATAAGLVAVGTTDDPPGSSNFLVARVLASGALDTSFGDGGLVSTDFGSSADTGFSALLQADGRILAIGAATSGGSTQLAIARYLPNGDLDKAFGPNGTGRIVFPQMNVAGAALQPDGRIVLVGYPVGPRTSGWAGLVMRIWP